MVFLEASFMNKKNEITRTGPIRIAYHNKVTVKDIREGINRGWRGHPFANNTGVGIPKLAVIENDNDPTRRDRAGGDLSPERLFKNAPSAPRFPVGSDPAG